MNIFVVDIDPTIAAQSLCDKHIVKMSIESAQLLCSYYPNTAPYKRSYHNHPCAIWCRESLSNYLWLVCHGLALCDEYSYRYGRVHKSRAVIEWCGINLPSIVDTGLTRFRLCMPDEYKVTNVVESYRAYYRGEKKYLLTYTKREPPEWLDDIAAKRN